jgi:hypothetical protein
MTDESGASVTRLRCTICGTDFGFKEAHDCEINYLRAVVFELQVAGDAMAESIEHMGRMFAAAEAWRTLRGAIQKLLAAESAPSTTTTQEGA